MGFMTNDTTHLLFINQLKSSLLINHKNMTTSAMRLKLIKFRFKIIHSFTVMVDISRARCIVRDLRVLLFFSKRNVPIGIIENSFGYLMTM